ncbi:LD-carboxypeptidase [Alkalihalophilus marmarensis]|jgi:muramoyltetrapeptide carboxypeptidase LdcA involved in peptidoglycan recycling|uniref:Peptidase S66 n=1 Tax=Alkalihalophilus marmarensis DSM 21297 TaxID=1188261 RepID=U6SJJ8_9BACI|nr:S66 peptidase family protein [Alkalihalophilus marmarensis]ERN51110.1 peptidase S66 [Alkalihalophilus marmarensis DSM 21297]MCM3491389.1 LD-carboxypeptidase [Alkalihalophilus marmarensis]
MITYPYLKQSATIGVTAPSSGVPDNLHPLLKQACTRLEAKGYQIRSGTTAWTQQKARSASAEKRAEEFNSIMADPDIDAIIPPWGGELLIEMLDGVDFKAIQPKWVLGYSDVSLLLLAITLKTGIATAHGTNLVDLRGEESDEITAMWEHVLCKKKGEGIVQHSSDFYQKEWNFEEPSPHIFHLTEPTTWRAVNDEKVVLEGRLLGGCIDVIRHLIGTPYGDVRKFYSQFGEGKPIIWYLENCELTTTDLKRTLVHMKLAGWFDHCTGIMFGRSGANQPVQDYTVHDVYSELQTELGIPVVYDIDCGHMPPQLTLINGAHAKVLVDHGRGMVEQSFI